MRTWRREYTLLALIVAMGAALRLWGLLFGLPQPLARPDEEHIVTTAVGFFGGDWNPHDFDWPSLRMYVVHGLLYLQYLAGHLTGIYENLPAFVRAISESPVSAFLVTRLFSVACGVATLLVVYRVAAAVVTTAEALMATFFLAVAILHVRDSHFGVFDVPLTLLVMLATFCLVRAWQRQRALGWLFVGGVLAGLATSTKYNAAVLAAVAIVVSLLRVIDRRDSRREAVRGLGLFGVAMLLAFVAGSPYVLLDRAAFLNGLRIQREHALVGHFGILIEHPLLHHVTFGLRYGLGLPLLVAGLLGIATMIVRDWRKALVLLTFPLLSFLALGVGYVAFARYLIPILPFLCIAAGMAVWTAVGWIRSSGRRIVAAAATTLAIAAPALVMDIKVDRVLSQEDTRALAARWLADHDATTLTTYASGEIYARPYLTPASTGPQLEFSTRTGSFVWGEKQSMAPDPEWIVLPESPLSRYTRVPDPVRELVLRDYIPRHIFLAARSLESPDWFDQQDAFFVPLASLRLRDRPGPDLYIYQRRAHQSQWPTLAEQVQALGVDAAGLPAAMLEKRITSFAQATENGRAALAYYVDTGDNTLRAPLFVALKDPGQPWRQSSLTNSGFDPTFGSAMSIRFTSDFMLVTTHESPSASDLLVIRRRDLSLQDSLYGWFQTELPDGKIVFAGSMVHFAPMHQETLHLYDPAARRNIPLYAVGASSQIRQEFIDRLRPVYAKAAAQGAANSFGGWDPTWFDVSVDDASFVYSSSTDELTFTVTLSGNHPPEIADAIVQALRVVCRPMRTSAPTCTEEKR